MSTTEAAPSGDISQHPHDLISYRDTGELSDLTVTLEGESEMRLHRFPLYIKCDYFRERATDSRVELPRNFPGGAACFAKVADFCYGKRLDIGPENCAQLNCAAKALGMTGRDNLAELTDRYLEDLLRSAQLTRAMGPVVDLLAGAAALDCGEANGEGKGEGDDGKGEGGGEGKGERDPAASIAERCFAALLDAWTRPGHGLGGVGSVGERLLRLPLAWFARLIGVASASDGDRQRRALAELTARYLHRVFLRHDRLEKKAEAEAAKDGAADGAEAKAENDDEEQNKGSDAEAETDESAVAERRRQQRLKEAADEAEAERQFEPKEPAGQVLDKVVLALPEATPLAEVISADWIQRALRISEEAGGCECRGRLLQLAGNTLHRFKQEELHQMPSPVLCDIVSSTVRNKGVQPEVLSCVIDNHLLDLARAGSLDADDFVKLAGCVPAEYRASHDALYEVAETLLSAGDSIPDEKQKEVIDTVDLSRCDVATLQRALDKGVIPVKVICQSAIELAKRLKQQLPSDGGRSAGLRFRDDSRSGRFPVSGRRYESFGGGGYGRQSHLGGAHVGSSSVYYTDPYSAMSPYGGPLGHQPDDAEVAESGRGYYEPPVASRYTALDYDADLLLLEAERSAQAQQRPSAADYHQHHHQHLGARRTRKW